MQIFNQRQNNQGISRYKLLSGNAGVGSIVTTKSGYYILISDINKWEFIRASNARIGDIIKDQFKLPVDWYKESQKDIVNNLGVELVDDERFVEFLKKDKDLKNLLCLGAIPHLSLNDSFNSINIKDNPIIARLKEKGIDKKPTDFTVPGTHFPKWFRNRHGELREYKDWKRDWIKVQKLADFFAPPRDANDAYTNSDGSRKRRKVSSTSDLTIEECRELIQQNMILICENGHLSDIPWSRYLKWKTENKLTNKKDNASDLFSKIDPCCDSPKLKWTENKNKSEGYASIFIECTNTRCLIGSGIDDKRPKINLEGVNNLKPICPGHRPWEMSLENDNDNVPYDMNCCDSNGRRSTMQVALVTGNNVYFANTFSSIYMPIELVKGITKEMDQLLKICNQRYERVADSNKSPRDWAERKIDIDFLDENGIKGDKITFLAKLKELFIRSHEERPEEDEDLHEVYRWQEYQVLTTNSSKTEKGLSFNNMELTKELSGWFKSIKKVEELKVTSVQLDFTRVSPNERVVGSDGNVVRNAGKEIFSISSDEVYIIPAVENFGEGIFFQFDDNTINKWLEENALDLSDHISPLLPTPDGSSGNGIRQKINQTRGKSILVHTFSHLIMRELEFSCGYPTASLKERLYISPRMSGVLIYTAEGSEGSMGGLVWQVQSDNMSNLIEKAFERAFDCSSDPLCWESEGQGVFNLNLAACFSCALVSETACEERNLGLDRRILVDPNFGFFKSLT
jgi:hypothetical protein